MYRQKKSHQENGDNSKNIRTTSYVAKKNIYIEVASYHTGLF